ncbi:MAG: DUF1707 domain-containing protein [Streptosporangiales bacterium]|nr:DUF1707 domain-containing protein [Streptosporangiales bacterium]MBO0889478.1 DUF1707 domain-containing protein [Acidothermales bacterium]
MTENRAADGPAVRVGDAERDVAAHELGEHYAVGRLTADEFRDRLGRVFAARTEADLDVVLADLPRSVVESPVDRRSSRVPVRTLAAAGLLALGLGAGVGVGHAHTGPDGPQGPPGHAFRVHGDHLHGPWTKPGGFRP